MQNIGFLRFIGYNFAIIISRILRNEIGQWNWRIFLSRSSMLEIQEESYLDKRIHMSKLQNSLFLSSKLFLEYVLSSLVLEGKEFLLQFYVERIQWTVYNVLKCNGTIQ